MLTDLRILGVDTVMLGWRLFPQLLSVYLLGWLGSQLALKVAVIVGDLSAWLALIIFATSFLFTLVAVVVILRLCGRELGIPELIPADEAVGDDRDSSLVSLLAVTLLPFLGLYAAFGNVQDRAARLSNEQIFRNSILGENSVLQVVADLARNHVGRLLLILLAIYVLRRLLDWIHDRTGRPFIGLVVAFVEATFLLLVIFGGFGIVNRATRWFRDRAFMGWIDQAREAVLGVLATINAALPAIIGDGLSYFADEIGPVLWEVVSQPIIWLAVAALIFGSNVLSLAELWRRGRPLAGRIPGASHFSKYRDKVALRRVGPPPVGVRRAAAAFKDAFLGDIDDKYLPTFHSLRLVLRAGATFVGAYVFCYTVLQVLTNYVDRALYAVIGGRDVGFWFMAEPIFGLIKDVPLELLRLCLLAVAFRRCLELLALRGQQVAAAEAAARPPVEASEPSAATA